MGALAVATATLLSLSVAPPQRTCGPLSTSCYRGANTLVRFKPSAPESASPTACCAACLKTTNCTEWQLVNETTAAEEPWEFKGCWLSHNAGTRPLPHPTDQCVSARVTRPNPRFNVTHFEGVWFQNGHITDIETDYYVRGGDWAIRWADIEVADGVFDFSLMDSTFDYAAATGMFIETALSTGEAAPDWLFDRKGGNASVPKVKVMNDGAEHTFPYYLDPTYQQLFLRAMEAFAAHIATYPHSVRSRITAVQAMYGSTGDDCPWHCDEEVPGSHGTCVTKPAKYEITNAEWHNFTMSTVKRVCEIYTARDLHVLWNTNWTHTRVQLEECPNSYLKAGSVSHGFQINDEYAKYLTEGAACREEGRHCRGESYPFCEHGYYLEAPFWATYSQLLWQLTFGVDMPGLTTRNLANATYTPLYELFNKYAPSVRPPASNWAGAIIALRDGLDGNDTVRFPTSKYGVIRGKKQNVARVLKIANDHQFKSRGARVGDPVAAQCDSMCSRHRNSSNDVGWGIFTNNYGNGRIEQIDATATSVGYWHVGPQDQPYGRFARGFDQSANKTEMSFTLDARLWGGLPRTSTSSPPLHLTLKVVYFNEGNAASFDVLYDSTDDGPGECRTAASIHTDNSTRWSVYEINITDGAFGKMCSNGADIVLRSTSSTGDAIIHSVEIYDADFVLPSLNDV